MLMVSSYRNVLDHHQHSAAVYFMSEFYGQILHNVIYYTMDRNLIVDRIIEVLFPFRQTLRVVKIFIVFYLCVYSIFALMLNSRLRDKFNNNSREGKASSVKDEKR